MSNLKEHLEQSEVNSLGTNITEIRCLTRPVYMRTCGLVQKVLLGLYSFSFVRFVKRNCAHFTCCANSESSIDVDFNDESEEQFMEESWGTLDECIQLIMSQNEA